MKSRMTHWGLLGALLVSAGAWLPDAASAAPAPPQTDAMPPAAKVRKALEQTVRLEVNAIQLTEALDLLKDQIKVNFVLDQWTIQMWGIETEAVNLKVDGTKARVALKKLLSPYNLAYVIIEDSVVITSPEMAIYRQLRQSVSVDVDDIPLQTALRQLAQRTAVNLLVDPRIAKDAQSNISLQLDEVPLETAVRLMAESAGLKAARVGNVLIVTSEGRAAKLRAESDLITPPSLLGGGSADPVYVPPRQPLPPAVK